MPASKREALDKFLTTDAGKELLSDVRRIVDVLKAEQEKDSPRAYSHRHAPNLRIEHQEHKLAAAIARAREETAEKLQKEDFSGALRSLAKLQAPLQAFFEHVTVNVENARLRLNRLRLLAEARRVMASVADFEKISAGDEGAV
jgi:glycyl-tRNA synthetase beta chain